MVDTQSQKHLWSAKIEEKWYFEAPKHQIPGQLVIPLIHSSLWLLAWYKGKVGYFKLFIGNVNPIDGHSSPKPERHLEKLLMNSIIASTSLVELSRPLLWSHLWRNYFIVASRSCGHRTVMKWAWEGRWFLSQMLAVQSGSRRSMCSAVCLLSHTGHPCELQRAVEQLLSQPGLGEEASPACQRICLEQCEHKLFHIYYYSKGKLSCRNSIPMA